MSFTRTRRFGMSLVAAIALVTILAAPAMAQQPAAADPNPGSMTVTAGLDFLNAYMFRGIRQNATEMAMWPYVDFGLALFSGDGGVKSVGVNVGTWNSLHTGDTGTDGPSGKLWYESDFYTTLNLGLGQGVSFGATYTAYTSPNNAFSTVKEIMFRVGMDDTQYLGKAALKPYAIVAFEFDTTFTPGTPAIPGTPGTPATPGTAAIPATPGIPFTTGGQADGGANAGRYLELGIAPTWVAPAASVVFPVKLGLSLSDYYELNVGTATRPVFADSNVGYLSVAAIATVPLGGTTSFGAWNLHGGLEFQMLGDTTEALNSGDATKLIGSIGIGLSY
ncbi:MAG: hypothetical protein HW394_633 [Acidobacteria bacterium]|nr:hypothetical protein [Acidobacteriota bacterium]